MGIRFFLFAPLSLVACVSSPDVPDPGSGRPPEQVYADVLLNYTRGREFGSCRKELPQCDVPLDTPCDKPDDMPDLLAVLGQPDEASYTFDADGRLDVGIHCGAVTEAGPLLIHATGSKDTQANVFVSLDGIYFEMIGVLVGGRQEPGPGDQPDAGVGADADAGVGADAGGDVAPFTGSFSLTTYGFHSIRYIRLFDTGGGGLSIDSIEGTWSGSPL